MSAEHYIRSPLQAAEQAVRDEVARMIATTPHAYWPQDRWAHATLTQAACRLVRQAMKETTR